MTAPLNKAEKFRFMLKKWIWWEKGAFAQEFTAHPITARLEALPVHRHAEPGLKDI